MTVEHNCSENQEQEHPPLAELVRKVMLAGIGMASLAQEEAEIFIQKLIEKGELAEKEGQGLVRDLREKRHQKIEERLDHRVATIVEKMKIPTQSDMDTLKEKIAELSKKIDDLKQ